MTTTLAATAATAAEVSGDLSNPSAKRQRGWHSHSAVFDYLALNLDKFVDARVLELERTCGGSNKLDMNAVLHLIARRVPLDGVDWSRATYFDLEIASANPFCIDVITQEDVWKKITSQVKPRGTTIAGGQFCMGQNPSPRALELLERFLDEHAKEYGIDVLDWAEIAAYSPHAAALFQKYFAKIEAAFYAKEWGFIQSAALPTAKTSAVAATATATTTATTTTEEDDLTPEEKEKKEQESAAAAAAELRAAKEKYANSCTENKIIFLLRQLCKNPHACEWVLQTFPNKLQMKDSEATGKFYETLAICPSRASAQYVISYLETKMLSASDRGGSVAASMCYKHLSCNPQAIEWLLQKIDNNVLPTQWEWFVSNPHPDAVARTETYIANQLKQRGKLNSSTSEQRGSVVNPYHVRDSTCGVATHGQVKPILASFSANPGAVSVLLERHPDWIQWGSFSGNCGILRQIALPVKAAAKV